MNALQPRVVDNRSSATEMLTLPDGGAVPLAWRDSDNEHLRLRFNRALEAAHGPGHRVTCPCSQKLGLVIKHNGGNYYLANLEGHGPKHDSACAFHASTYIGGNLADRYQGAIKVTATRTMISVDVALSEPTSSSKQSARSPAKTRLAPTTRQGRTSLHGLLNFLLERGRFNQWHPSKPTPSPAYLYATTANSPNIFISGHRLADLIITPPAIQSIEDAHRAQYAINKRILRARARRHAVLLLFLLDALDEEGPLDLPSRINRAIATMNQSAYLPPSVVEAAETSYARQLRYRGDQRLLVIASAFSRGNALHITSLAIRHLTRAFIPCDSLYEAAIAHVLVDTGRTFIKPLSAKTNDTLPDFILKDTNPETVMEIFGRTDTAYLQKAAEKRAAGIWSWDASSRPNWPPIPPPTSVLLHSHENHPR